MFSLKHNLIVITFVVIAICTLQVMSVDEADMMALLMTHCGFKNDIGSDRRHNYEESLHNDPNREQLKALLDKLKPSIPKINTSTDDEVERSARRIANVYQTNAIDNLLNPEDPIGSLASSVDINSEIP